MSVVSNINELAKKMERMTLEKEIQALEAELYAGYSFLHKCQWRNETNKADDVDYSLGEIEEKLDTKRIMLKDKLRRKKEEVVDGVDVDADF